MTDTKAKTLTVTDKAEKSHEQLIAEIALGGLANGATLAADFSKSIYGELNLTECMETLRQKVKNIQGGNLAEAEALLTAQAISLDAIYAALARRSLMNMGEYTGAADTYMRLALKAQSQCRATLETLAAIKNPPMVIAKQANITNGPQQVNNGSMPHASRAPAPARAGNSETAPNKLLEESYEQRMDTRAAQAAGQADPKLEAVGRRLTRFNSKMATTICRLTTFCRGAAAAMTALPIAPYAARAVIRRKAIKHPLNGLVTTPRNGPRLRLASNP